MTRNACCLLLGWLLVFGAACQKKEACLDASKGSLDQCKANAEKLEAEVISLKRLLAQALANPGTIKVDPDVLTIDGKHIQVKLKEGSLTQEQLIGTFNQNKAVLQACYERAMKKNNSLTQQKISVTLGFLVKPTGNADNITISPNYDSMMVDCMRKAVMRWHFPTFTGQPVGAEFPLTLTPRK